MHQPSAHIDPGQLERSLRGLDVRREPGSLDQAVAQVLDAARVVFGATGTGLMAIDENRAVRYVGASDALGRLIEETQAQLGEGPCVDAFVYDTIVQTRDLAADDRWPDLTARLDGHAVHALIGVPVRVFGEPVGALDVYADRPYGWDDSDGRALNAYARLIGSHFASALQAQERGEVAEQLQRALDNRIMIERAVGVIMGRQDLDAVAAFNRLRTAARDRRVRVRDLAARVLEGESLA